MLTENRMIIHVILNKIKYSLASQSLDNVLCDKSQMGKSSWWKKGLAVLPETSVVSRLATGS